MADEAADLGNESDSTAYSENPLEKKLPAPRRYRGTSHSTPSRTPRSHTCLSWLRFATITALQIVIILLQVFRPSAPLRPGISEEVETGADINGLYPTRAFPSPKLFLVIPFIKLTPSSAVAHTYTHLKSQEEIYMPNMTSNEDREKVRHAWDLLMPLGSGSVSIPNWRDYPLLGEPIADDPLRAGPIFEASWTHALHCLYYSVDSYHQLIVNGRTGEENPHHAAHCFEYLRNSILCNLDMTLEGSYSTSREGGGQAHVCRDRDAAIAWIEARRVDDLQDIIGP
ncbi:MAG: hypothetical protein MMC33_002125 [Icmadophila ericetorum]|nr:hypothetical protein [Icmadophila ericetorum]